MDYEKKSFKEERELFTQFFYDEVSTGPGVTWCTAYYYRHLPDGRYRFVMIDTFDGELFLDEIYDTAEKFAKDVKADTSARELDPYLDDEILSLCPKDISKKKGELRRCFNEITAALIHCALIDGDRPLVKALLPDFNEMRAILNPTPYIPGISVKELERKKNLYREYFRSKGYVEEEPDLFVDRAPRLRHTYQIGKYSISYSTASPVGASHSSVLFENLKDPSVER